MPTTFYKISGSLAEGARIYVIREDTHEVEKTEEKTSGSFEVAPLASGTKFIAARKSDGQSVSYGNVNPISYVAYLGYVYGGYDGSNSLQDTDEYDPDTDTWTSKSNMPTPARNALAASTISDKGYVYGGSPGPLKNTDEYDPDSWTSKTNMPGPGRRDHASSTILDKGYIYCGNSGSDLTDTDEYDPDTWASKTNAPGPNRYALAASTISDKGYIYGGQGGGSRHEDTDEYSPDTWASKSDMPNERGGLSACAIDDKGYAFGGHNGSVSADTYEYSPDGNSWVVKSDMPSPARDFAAASTISDKGYVYAGSGGYLRDTDEYDPDTWTSKSDMPSPARYGLAASTI